MLLESVTIPVFRNWGAYPTIKDVQRYGKNWFVSALKQKYAFFFKLVFTISFLVLHLILSISTFFVCLVKSCLTYILVMNYYSLSFFSDMTTVLASLTPECREDVCVVHALAVRSALALSSYHRFFKLYKQAPKMSGYLMDWFADKVRLSALKAIVKAYVILVLLSFISLKIKKVHVLQEILDQ